MGDGPGAGVKWGTGLGPPIPQCDLAESWCCSWGLGVGWPLFRTIKPTIVIFPGSWADNREVSTWKEGKALYSALFQYQQYQPAARPSVDGGTSCSGQGRRSLARLPADLRPGLPSELQSLDFGVAVALPHVQNSILGRSTAGDSTRLHGGSWPTAP